jgi:hypothetical protein
MALMDLADWMDEYTGARFIWYAKRLSANDTLANHSHQAGPYIPREFLFSLFPNLNQPNTINPRVEFNLYIDSHADSRRVTAIWYNNKLRDGTVNEARVTNLGGYCSALLDPENTGALAVFAFELDDEKIAKECHVWVCEHETEMEIVEDRIGLVEPGRGQLWTINTYGQLPLLDKVVYAPSSCRLDVEKIPPAWLERFPSGAEIIKKTLELRQDSGMTPDKRLIRRRECEYEMFRSVEEAIEMRWIKQGFNTIDEFIVRAQSILQRRKSRAGRSLELHTKEILIEEGFTEGINFSHQAESEAGRRPDFLFPSERAYKDALFPSDKLRMLAVKTTCKDRWRQILEEAERVKKKHLLTLQEGVSENQFRAMLAADVQLIVPAPLIDSYPKSVRPHLKTLESFIADVRLLSINPNP